MENPTHDVLEQVVNAICVDVIDLGKIQTPWGIKPQIKFIFESDDTDEYGEQRLLIRTFHKHPHEKSALSIAMKSWTNRNLSEEAANGKWSVKNQKGQQARLKLQTTLTESGKCFDKIVEILPAGDVHVTPFKYTEQESD
jgi:hypothetical protein